MTIAATLIERGAQALRSWGLLDRIGGKAISIDPRVYGEIAETVLTAALTPERGQSILDAAIQKADRQVEAAARAACDVWHGFEMFDHPATAEAYRAQWRNAVMAAWEAWARG